MVEEGSILGVFTPILWKDDQQIIEKGITLGKAHTILRKLSKKEENHLHLAPRKHPDYYIILEIKGIEDFWYEELMKVLLALQLSKNNTVFFDFIIMYSSILDNQRINPLLNPPRMPFSAVFSQNEIDLVNRLLENLRSMDLDSSTSLKIACERFSRIKSSRYIPDHIIDACISYEALFLAGKRVSRSRREPIASACSELLGKTIEEKERIFDIVDLGFRVRNKIVHGSEIDLDKLHIVKTPFINYLRHAIIDRILSLP